MVDRFAGLIGHKVLFRHIGDVIALLVFGQQMIEGLVLGRAAVFGDVLLPFIGVREHRVHIENDTTKRMLPMTEHLPDVIFCMCGLHPDGALHAR